MSTPRLSIAAEQAARYREDGYVIIDGLVEPGLLGDLRARVEALLAGADDDPRSTSRVDAEHKVLQKISGLTREPGVFHRLATEPALVEVVEALIGEEPLIFRDVLVVKPARQGASLAWHQDSAYWDIDPPALVSAWVALADVPEDAGCLRVVPGSHRMEIEHDLPLTSRRNLPRPITRLLRGAVSLAGTGDNPEGAGGSPVFDRLKRFVLGTATRVFPVIARLGDYSVTDEVARAGGVDISLPVHAGSVIFFHSLLLHASGPNTTDGVRAAPIISYMGSSYRFTGRGDANFLPARRPES
ncbi:MAG TPA: phytanoyl-CoA dioxygenase family protein [Gaiellaceae bacterium]|nr:phytanoyl-CoA dioxygenase family protein [Gaiellaceae bacterium]